MSAPPEPFERVVWYGCALLVAWALTLVAGCCTNAGSSATCARKVVTGMYSAVGAATVISRVALKQCEDKAVADKSDAELQKCATAQSVLAKALPAAADACGATSSALDAGEKLAAKNFGDALAPLYAAGVQLAQALTIAGVHIPFPVPGVN
jgi:hypothetical protein